MEKLFNDSFENWIFDLDNTIYDIKAGLFVKISERITQYIMEVLSFKREEANLVRSDMYKKYGLNGHSVLFRFSTSFCLQSTMAIIIPSFSFDLEKG